ncbi:Transmembrane and coiled-coil domain-containing protein 4, partial [Irineochytrium annulatum]
MSQPPEPAQPAQPIPDLPQELALGLFSVVRLLLDEDRDRLEHLTSRLPAVDSQQQSFNLLSFAQRRKSTGAVYPALTAYDEWRKATIEGVGRFNGFAEEQLKGDGAYNSVGAAAAAFRRLIAGARITRAAEGMASATEEGAGYAGATPMTRDGASDNADRFDEVMALACANLINSSMVEGAIASKELRYDARLRSLMRELIRRVPAHLPPGGDDAGAGASSVFQFPLASSAEALKAASLLLQSAERAEAIGLVNQAKAVGSNAGQAGGSRAGSRRSSITGEGASADRASAAVGENSEGGRETRDKTLLKWMTIGLATVGGGVVVGVTGGLAAPLIGAGLGSLLTGLGVTGTAAVVSVLGTSAGAALVGTLFGVTGGGIAGYKFKRRLQGIEECYFRTVAPQEASLHVVICISGWLETLDDAFEPWNVIPAFAPFSEVQLTIWLSDSMVFDSHHLLTLGAAFKDFLTSGAASYAATEVLKHTILGGLVLALVWPVGLLQLSYLVDNPWSIGLDRAKKAGGILAKEVLIPQVHGKRAVTLVGWGLGARAIFYALLEVAAAVEGGNMTAARYINLFISISQRPKPPKYSIVDSVYLFGAPVEGNPDLWTRAASVVAGRLVNGYSSNDWFLHFLYRASSPNDRVAGLHPMATLSDFIQGRWPSAEQLAPSPTSPNGARKTGYRPRVENFQLADLVQTHLKYKERLPDILERVGFERAEGETTLSAGAPLAPGTAAAPGSPASTTASSTLLGSAQSLEAFGPSTRVNSSHIPTTPAAEDDPDALRLQILSRMPRKSSLAHIDAPASSSRRQSAWGGAGSPLSPSSTAASASSLSLAASRAAAMRRTQSRPTHIAGSSATVGSLHDDYEEEEEEDEDGDAPRPLGRLSSDVDVRGAVAHPARATSRRRSEIGPRAVLQDPRARPASVGVGAGEGVGGRLRRQSTTEQDQHASSSGMPMAPTVERASRQGPASAFSASSPAISPVRHPPPALHVNLPAAVTPPNTTTLFSVDGSQASLTGGEAGADADGLASGESSGGGSRDGRQLGRDEECVTWEPGADGTSVVKVRAGRRSTPVEAAFEPGALAVEPLSRGGSSESLGEDMLDRSQAEG